MTFGEKLQGLRKRRGWTQEELAEKIAVLRQALSKWESGAAVPDTENVFQLSKVFGVSTDYLLHDEFESDDDIPAVQTKSDALSRKYAGVVYAAIGSIVSLLGAAGILVMLIMSSLGSYTISAAVPSGNGTGIVRTGLPAFLERYGIGWLFILCVVLVVVGIVVALLPKLRTLRKK